MSLHHEPGPERRTPDDAELARPHEPGPQFRALTDEELSRLLGEQHFGALATGAGLSTVGYTWDPGRRVVRISTVADRLKLHQDPRCALYVASGDFQSYAVAEGTAEMSPVSGAPGDEVGRELLAMQPAVADEAAFLRRMVAGRRLVVRLRVARLYGTALPPAPVA
ncbi:pyridoxamine 5'-phosphate oxidase family protein [Nonomuraea jiangxiensis]|uniref:Pyridoxamine 5'-phosphate oxidase n=1 Tax=Nonomuraea jiangxiensis TaxID=633440 RepID=A0A1G9EBD9_9ACTN|nr:pyridoxamine 5'-phosphate oxidase family protein [Nonomuraea jiangxiensis]SDK73470.1 Pyridoxamine 5'-phosphate oxidase [Nonomuraea jiangxiensis]